MITIKLGQLDGIINSLRNIVSKELPIKISYSLSKLTVQIENEYKNYTTQRMLIINKYAEKDENNKIKVNDNFIPLKKECTDLCNKDLSDLNNIEFSVDFSPISISELEIELEKRNKKLEVKPQDLVVLNQFFID